MRILTWHVHGSYLFYLAQARHDFLLPVKPGRPEGYGGRGGLFPWPDNVFEVEAERVRDARFDCVLFQSRKNWEHDQWEILTEEQRRLPRIYLEHNPPDAHPTDTVHHMDDPSVLLVHPTHYNNMMWDSGRARSAVIEHGVLVPEGLAARGALARGIVVVNDLARRGRRLGSDIFEQISREVPLDLAGMGSEPGGLGDLPRKDLFERMVEYRFLFSPIRHMSLGLSICEAMMLGLPVVGLATNEMPSLIENGVSGYLDNDLSRLAEKMRQLLREPAEARRLGEGARRLARERFHIERFTQDWDEAFRLVAGGPRGAKSRSARKSEANGASLVQTRPGNGSARARIAVISEHASPIASLGGVDAGGQNVYVAQTARHLADLGYQVDVFTRRDDPDLPEIVDWMPGIRVVNVPAGPPQHVRKEEMLPFMGELAAWLTRFIQEQEIAYDLVHANFWMSGLVACEVKRALGLPFVITFHALGRVRRLHQGDSDGFPEQRFDIERRIVEEADAIVAECPQDRADLIHLYSADASRIEIVPCGYDPEELAPVSRAHARQALTLDPNEPLILQLGRMVPRKGVDDVIRALALVRGKWGHPARLLVVGGAADASDEQTRGEMQRLAEVAGENGVAGEVRFVGPADRGSLELWYSAADVFVSTPWYEPFGITPLEAMACGTPVVGADVGGIKYTVVHEETGFLVPPRDPEAIAERVAQLLSRPELREKMGKKGRERVARYFTWSKVADQLALLYQDVLRRSKVHELGLHRGAELIDKGFETLVDSARNAHQALRPALLEAADVLVRCIEQGNKIMTCGNGGSAADAQHLVAELVGRYRRRDRPALAALSLNSDTAVMTAWSNDEGFEHVFARQVEALARPGDVLVGISTSGRSPNVIRAMEAAKERGAVGLALVDGDGDLLNRLADVSLRVPCDDTQRIQEIHTFLIHMLVELVEERLVGRLRAPTEANGAAGPLKSGPAEALLE
ncbi:MAG: glycosyltransferase, partial [Myxococcota bacterium]